MTKEEIVDILKKYVVQVRFKKVDGTTRIMSCTLSPSRLPEVDPEKETKPRKDNDNVVSAWNVDLQEWRSFRVDSVERIVWIEDASEHIWEKTEV